MRAHGLAGRLRALHRRGPEAGQRLPPPVQRGRHALAHFADFLPGKLRAVNEHLVRHVTRRL
jgi:hypothetical protein